MPVIEPTDAQIAAFMNAPQDEAFTMVNLNCYRERADYPDDYDGSGGPADVSGHEAYHRYGFEAFQAIVAVGGEISFSGTLLTEAFVPSGEENWDEVVLVRYPSFKAFLSMMERPSYMAAFVHRDAGLAHARVFPCKAFAF